LDHGFRIRIWQRQRDLHDCDEHVDVLAFFVNLIGGQPLTVMQAAPAKPVAPANLVIKK
jgi:hypothetical protein